MKQLSYKGKSIELENNGWYSIYFVGNAYATSGGFKTIDEAKAYIDKWF